VSRRGSGVLEPSGRVAVILPALNEAAVIGRVVRAALRRPEVDAVYVVDDGSRDGTAAAARRAGARVIVHPRNRGVGAALRTGYRAAARAGFETLVTMGADDQDNAAEIPRLLAAIEAGRDFVQGSRWLARGRVVDIPLFRRVATIGYSLLFTLLARRRVTDGTNGFRAFRTRFLRSLRLERPWLDTYELEPYLYWHALRDGWRTAEVPVTKRYPRVRRGYHYTKMRPIRDWWRILRPLLLLATGLRR
jgi:dolichol-phosphate mannosyltransferase